MEPPVNQLAPHLFAYVRSFLQEPTAKHIQTLAPTLRA